MALSDGIASASQVEAANARTRERAELAKRAAELEAARASEERMFTDDLGNRWRYVVLDGAHVRIVSLEPAVLDIVIPDAIEGLPVRALGPDACAHLDTVQTIRCPDSMISIGHCAFRNDSNLRSIHLPRDVAEFDSDWLRRCTALERLELPGRLEKVSPYIFDIPNLKQLRIGAATAAIEPGAFAKSRLQEVEVDAANEFLATDGFGIYSKEGDAFLALAVALSEYDVAQGVRVLAKKAFGGFGCLARIGIPDSVEVVSEYAYAKTAVASFEAPSSLRAIMDRAFFDCTSLEHVRLCEGLVWIGDNAFSNTRLSQLALPSSIEHIGHPLAARSRIVYAGADATLSIGPASSLMLDGEGGLYERRSDGSFLLVRLIDPTRSAYAIKSGTVEVAERAFAGHERIESVEVPEGVLRIGAGAFRSCRSLRHAQLPASLVEIGKEAFLGCNLEELMLPRDLAHVGEMALVMHGAHHGASEPSLRDLRVDPCNPRFFMAGSLLMERRAQGGYRVIHCTDTEPCVEVPAGTKEIAPYALNGMRNIEELSLSTEVGTIGMRGLAVDCHLASLRISFDPPVEGHASFEFRFPRTDRGTHHLQLALGVPQFLDVEGLFAGYDSAIVHARNFDSTEETVISLYEQALNVIARLEDPVCMTRVNQGMLERFLANHIEKVCASIAKRDDKAALGRLVDLGFVNAENIAGIIECVGALQDASVTGYLLTIKRDRFGRRTLDLSL